MQLDINKKEYEMSKILYLNYPAEVKRDSKGNFLVIVCCTFEEALKERKREANKAKNNRIMYLFDSERELKRFLTYLKKSAKQKRKVKVLLSKEKGMYMALKTVFM